MLSLLDKKSGETHGVELNKDCNEIAERNMFKLYNKLSKVKNLM